MSPSVQATYYRLKDRFNQIKNHIIFTQVQKHNTEKQTLSQFFYFAKVITHFEINRKKFNVLVLRLYHSWWNWNLEMLISFFGEGKTGKPGEKPFGAKDKPCNYTNSTYIRCRRRDLNPGSLHS